MEKKEVHKRENRSRYEELCRAYDRVQQEYRQIEDDCINFSKLLLKNFIDYFEVPEKNLSYYKISNDNQFDLVLPEMERALTYSHDGYWHFGLGMTIHSSFEKHARDLILIHLFLRKDLSGNFFTRIAREPAEFEIDKHKRSSFDKFFKSIEETVIKSYDEGFQKFIGHHTERKLGYRIDSLK